MRTRTLKHNSVISNVAKSFSDADSYAWCAVSSIGFIPIREV